MRNESLGTKGRLKTGQYGKSEKFSQQESGRCPIFKNSLTFSQGLTAETNTVCTLVAVKIAIVTKWVL